MTTNSQSCFDQPVPAVDPNGAELELPDHMNHNADLLGVAMGMGFFYSHGCDTEPAMVFTCGDFRHPLTGVGRI